MANLTKTAATELRPHGVRVNTLLPGFIGTDLVTAAVPGGLAREIGGRAT